MHAECKLNWDSGGKTSLLVVSLCGVKGPGLNHDKPNHAACNVTLKLKEDGHLESRDKIFKREKARLEQSVEIERELKQTESLSPAPHMEGL